LIKVVLRFRVGKPRINAGAIDFCNHLTSTDTGANRDIEFFYDA